MPYSKEIEEKVDTALGKELALQKKKMFGGICYMLNGNMAMGIHKDYLIVRVGNQNVANGLIDNKHVLPFDLTGKAMKGWVMVDNYLLDTDEAVIEWGRLGLDYAGSLPAK